MTVQQTMAALRVSRTTIFRMMKAGELTNVAPILPARKIQPVRFATGQVDRLRPQDRQPLMLDGDLTPYQPD